MSVTELIAVAGGLALLLAPGAFLLAALGEHRELDFEELPATWLALTLAVFAVPATAAALLPVRIDAVIVWLVVVALAAAISAAASGKKHGVTSRLAAIAARRKSADTDLDDDTRTQAGEARQVSRALLVLAGIATALLALGAYAFTRGGSVDRWWYLAFVRASLVDNLVTTADPLLGSGTSIARFACNSWLVALATWARVTAVDPVVIYERAAPLILAPLALSATASAVRALLRDRSTAISSVVIAAAYWTSGGPFPALTRLPEDKILAILILVPVLWAAAARAVSRPRFTAAPLLMVALTATALATVHPLVFVIGLVTVAPTLLVARRRVAIALVLVLAVVAVVPIVVGLDSREQVAQSASLAAEEHPVGRLHASRERVEEVGGFLQVEPRLLADPLSILALLALPFLIFRGRRERALLVMPSIAALALCFVPPLTTLLARAVTPWMTYRFLWAIPFVPLLAVVVRSAARRMPLGYAIPLVCILALALPGQLGALDVHTRAAREALATPTDEEFHGLVAALRSLPQASVIAAAPELAERIPGLSGRHVLAASDRATVVFDGSVERAAGRLRDRAAVLGGIWRQSDGTPAPTHVVLAPGAPAARYCGERIFASEHYEMCSFRAAEPVAGMKLGATTTEPMPGTVLDLAGGDAVGYRVDCSPEREATTELIVFPRPGPWSPRAPGVICTVTAAPVDARGMAATLFHPRTLTLEVVTGRAVEELTILARADREGRQRWNLRTRETVRQGDLLRYAFPSGGVDRVEIALIPSRLPFVKLGAFKLTLDENGAGAEP